MKKERTKGTMDVAGFNITAWKDSNGIMRLEIRSLDGRHTCLGLNLPWEGESNDGRTRMMFTSNENIIEDLTGDNRAPDGRSSPEFLRLAAKDPVYRAFTAASRSFARTPEEKANRIEDIRRSEGRDPATGALLAPMATA